MSNSDNPRNGVIFQEQVMNWFQNQYGRRFQMEKKLPIGNPAKDHKFDKNKCKQLRFKRTYGVHAFRKTLNSDMRHDNVSVQMCASMIGNTEEVNNLHYTYDISRMDEKREAVKKAHAKRAYE